MLSTADYIRLSLGLHLFFLRTMKEHALFLEVSFTAKNRSLADTASFYKRHFEMLLGEAVMLANGKLRPAELESGQYVTPFTVDAEGVTQFYTGVPIDISLTQRTAALAPGTAGGDVPGLENAVAGLNQKALSAVTALVGFKSSLLTDVMACKLFMSVYPLLIDHIIREANLYIGLMMRLQSRADFRTQKDLADLIYFWNHIMAEHAKFIRGFLDPTEVELFDTADAFGQEFDTLTGEAKQAQADYALIAAVAAKSLTAAEKLRDFKAAGTGGILQCKIRSIILPLLADHVLREANHYIYLLK